jgi:hypothetical protein
MKKFEIWMSKYWTGVGPGQFGWVPRQRLDIVEAEDFLSACAKYAHSNYGIKHLGKSPHHSGYKFGPTVLFATEQDAIAYEKLEYAWNE